MSEFDASFRAWARTTSAGVVVGQGEALYYVNPAVCEFTGFREEELLGMTFWELVHPDFREVVKARGLAWQRGEEVSPHLEFVIRTKEGSCRWVDSTAASVSLKGKPAFLAMLFDITERKLAEERRRPEHEEAKREAEARQAELLAANRRLAQEVEERKGIERALFESRSQLEAILNNTTAFIYVKDLEGRFLFVNRHFERAARLAQKEAIGKTDYDLFPKDMADTFRANDRQVIDARRPIEFEESAPRRSGVGTLLSLKFPLVDAEGRPYAVCGISTDITERKRVEQLKSEFSRRLLRAIEEERRRMARELHDEVGQLLAAVSMRIQALERDAQKGVAWKAAAVQELADMIKGAVESVARVARGQYPTELSDLGIGAALSSYAGQLAKRHGLRLALKVGDLDGVLDRDQKLHIYRVVQEALHNVVRHSRARSVCVSVKKQRGSVVAVVEDDGQGFECAPAGDLDGGLGLTTMRERAELVGGELLVRSRRGLGTRVEIRVPLENRTGRQKRGQAFSEEPSRAKGGSA